MKYVAVIFALTVLSFITAYGDEIKYTSFEIILSPDDFDKQGPNHQILILGANQSASIPITIKNHDSSEHEISLMVPAHLDPSDVLQEYSFEPSLVVIPPNSEKKVKLNLVAKNNTDSHWGTMHVLAQSKTFGITSKYFYIVIGDKNDEIDPFIDHSLRSGLPGAAFPNLYNDFGLDYSELLTRLDSMTPNNIGVPRYIPDGYSFQGISNSHGQYPFLVFAKTPVTNSTESTDFIGKGGIMVYYAVDGVNLNRDNWIVAYAGQEESELISINGLIGVASEQEERVVVYNEAKYMFPAELNLSDGHYSGIGFRGNVPLDELVKMAASLPISGKTTSPLVISKAELYGPSSFHTKGIRSCFDDANTLGPWAVGWIEIQNQSNRTIITHDEFTIKTAHWEFGWNPSITLEPSESCIVQTQDQISTRKGVGGSEGNDPPAGYWGSSIRIEYFVGDDLFVNQTPEISDIYGDTRIWEMIDNNWKFVSGPFMDLSDIKNLPKQELQNISPLQQLKSGIPKDEIRCKEGFVIILKAVHGDPACVKPETKSKLMERKWGQYDPNISDMRRTSINDLAVKDHLVQKLLDKKNWHVRTVRTGISADGCPFGSCYAVIIDQAGSNETLVALVNSLTKKVIDAKTTSGW